MEEYLIELIQNQGLWAAYIVVFILSFLEYVFPPVPADTLLMFAGIMAGQGAFDPWSLFWLTVVGSSIGFLCVYWIGLYKGRRYFLKKNFPIFPAERITKLESWLERHGAKLILINRVFSGFRSLFFLVAGIGRMPLWKVGICGLISSVVWTTFLVWGGYYLGLAAHPIQKIRNALLDGHGKRDRGCLRDLSCAACVDEKSPKAGSGGNGM